MGINKGEDWGTAGSLPANAPIAATDAAAAALVAAAEPSALPITIGLRDGDLARTLGLRLPNDASQGTHLVLIDALRVELDNGSTHVALAHAIIGSPVRDGHVVAVMNAAFIGRRNVAPRGHPGDGKADVLTFNLRPVDRLKAARRMLTGSHMPHPGIVLRQRTEGLVELARRRPVQIDGTRVGYSQTLRFQVLPEAILTAV